MNIPRQTGSTRTGSSVLSFRNRKTFPFPRHVVFYNGTAEEPDRKVLRLSDLYETVPGDSHPSLECETLMLNINYGHNRSLMEKCRRLWTPASGTGF